MILQLFKYAAYKEIWVLCYRYIYIR